MAKAEYRSAIRSKKMITEALVDLLQEKPPDKITVTDVVNRAGINRGTFYAHYADIPDVIHHMIQSTFSKIQGMLPHGSEDIAKTTGNMLQQVQRMLEEDMELYKKLMCSGAAPLMYGQLVDTVLEYLLQHEKDYAPKNHEQFALAIRFCAGGLSNLYRDWFEGRLNMTLGELSQYAQDLLNGVMQMKEQWDAEEKTL